MNEQIQSDEEIINSYEYKVIERMLKRLYPFIVGLSPNEKQERHKYTTFIDLIIDYDKLSEYMGEESDYIRWMLEDGPHYDIAYLALIFRDHDVKTKAHKVDEDIAKIFMKVHDSKVIPKELSLTRDPRASRYRITRSDTLTNPN